jgi:periplasmic copper chaperone A
MSFRTNLVAALSVITLTSVAWAGDITIQDPYARSSTQSSATGAAFMVLVNQSDQNDRLISAQTDIAERVELHTHIEDANGIMQMREVEGGFDVPAGGMHALERGGDHVMFLGLKQPLKDGNLIPLTLSFEKAGDIVVEVPVDLTRKPMHGKMKHD